MQDKSTSQGKIKAKNKRTSSIPIFGSIKYEFCGIYGFAPKVQKLTDFRSRRNTLGAR
jgi:hypothetical protein